MSIGLIPLATQQYLSRLDYDLRAGRWHAVDRVQDAAGNWQSEKVELGRPTFIADLANHAIGYSLIQRGQAPDNVMHHCCDGMPACPSSDHKPSFELIVKLKGGAYDGELRKFGKSGITIARAFNELLAAWLALPESGNPALAPVVEITGEVAQKAGQSTNYAPKWKIAEFVPRPTEFDLWMPSRIASRDEATLATQEKDDISF